MNEEELIANALGNPEAALSALNDLDCEERLLPFIKLVWSVLEPGRDFVEGWAVEAMCEHLEAVSRGEIKRLLINVPPGCMKSLLTDVFWPTWEWGPRNMPHLRYVSASYSEAITIRDNRRSRLVIQSPQYQSRWGDRFKLMSDQNAKIRFDTDAMGFRIATSVNGLGTGERGDRIIVDDPHNIKEGESEVVRESALQWFTEVLPTRTVDPETCVYVVIMQRVHTRDVSGLILSKELGYEHLCLPMQYEARNRCFSSVPRAGVPTERVTLVRREMQPLPQWYTEAEFALEDQLPEDYKPEWQDLTPQDRRTVEGEYLWLARFSEHHIEKELKPMLQAWGGTYAEAGQLQQRPAPRGGGMFQKHDFNLLEELPDLPYQWVRGYDLAANKDGFGAFTVGVKLAACQGSIYVADVRRKRLTPKGVEDLVVNCAESDGHQCAIDIPQDPGQAGKFQKSYLIGKLVGYNAYSSPESGSKEDRARPLAAQCEAGNLYLLRGPWNDAFINEFCLFPNGEYMDQVDAASRALMRALMVRRRRVALGGVRLIGEGIEHGRNLLH